jgi:hypothetical protein
VRRLTAGLLGEQRTDGGWGAVASGPATTEATALTALAMVGVPDRFRSTTNDAASHRAVTWLLDRQRPDGSWPATETVPASSWMTSVALLTLARIAGDDPRAARAMPRAAAWLLGERAFHFDWSARIGLAWARLRGATIPTDDDANLIGWPWVEDTYSWVEPTSLALLALRSASARDRTIAADRRYDDRTDSARRMLLDRVVPGGGWNYGNTRVLGQDLVPYPDTTAWALLALRSAAPGREVTQAVAAGFARLPALLEGNVSSLARGLAALALQAHGRPADGLLDAMADRLTSGAIPSDTRSRALAVLALSGAPDPLGA